MTDSSTKRTVSVHLPTLIVAIVSGFLFAGLAWLGVSRIGYWGAQFAAFDLSAPGLLLASFIVAPILLWVISFFLGLTRRGLAQVAIFVMAFGVAATATVTINHIAYLSLVSAAAAR